MAWSHQHYWRRVGGRSHDTIPAATGLHWWALPTYRAGRGARPWSVIAEMFLLHGLLTTTFEDWGVITRLHDPQDYSGSAIHFFEAILVSSVAGQAARARLFNITLNEPVPGSLVATGSTSVVRLRSPGFTLPASDHEYRAQIGET